MSILIMGLFLIVISFPLRNIYCQTLQEQYIQARQWQKAFLETNYNTCVTSAIMIEDVDRRGEHFSVSGKPLHFALYIDSGNQLNIYTIKDTDIYRVNMTTGQIYHFTYETTGDGGRNYPLYFNCNNDGNLYICDMGRNFVGEYSSQGVFIRQIGSSFQFNSSEGPFPAYSYEDTVTMQSYKMFCVPTVFFDIVEWGGSSEEFKMRCRKEILSQEGVIFAPQQVIISKEGSIFINDFIDEARIQVFNQITNNFVASWLEKDLVGDTTPPIGSITIDSGVIATNTSSAILNLTATDTESAIGTMIISNFADFSIAETMPFASTQSWTLLAGEGIKKVYVKFIDIPGNVSPVYSDTIILDITPPITSINIETPTYSIENKIWITSSTTIRLNTVDSGVIPSGVKTTLYQVDTGTWQIFAESFTIQYEGAHILKYHSIDNAGNSEETNSISIFVDNTAPTVTIKSPLVGTTYVAKKDTLTIDFVVIDNADSNPQVTAFLTHIDTGGETIPVYNGWETDPLNIPSGKWILTVKATDFVENTRIETSGPFTIIHDILPPRTSTIIGEPRYGDTPTFVTSATTFTLSAVDDLVEVGDSIGLGVKNILFKIDDETWSIFADSFTLQTEQALPLQDGEYIIYYYSIDVIGNTEETNSLLVLLDNTPPTTTIEIANPKFINPEGKIWVNTFTLFTINAYDTGPFGSGIKLTLHRIDAGQWSSDTTPFWLKGYSEGEHKVEYYSIDNVGNTEETKSTTVFLDYTPPKTKLDYTPPYYNYGETLPLLVSSATLFILISEDTGSGVNRSEYTIDDRLPYNIYTVPFNIPSETFTYGIHTISYYSIDNVSNKEEENIRTVFLDNVPPVAELISPSNQDYGLCKVVNNETIPIIGNCWDGHFWYYKIEVNKKNENETQWQIISESTEQKENQTLAIWSTQGLVDGWYIIRLTAMDRVNNTTVDTTSIYLGKPELLLTLGAHGKEQGEFNHPFGIAFDDTQNIYITDSLNHRIQKFSPEGNFILEFGKHGKEEKEYNEPTGIAISKGESPSIYVADRNNNRIQVFDLQGNFIKEFGPSLNKPMGICLDSNGNLYVADRNNDRIVKFDKEGLKLNEFTGFNKQEGVFVDSENNLYVADRNNDRVVKLNSDGEAILILTGLNKPNSVIVNDRGYIYVSNTNDDSIAKFDKYGNLVMKFSSLDTFTLNKPAGLTVDKEGNLFIVDENNNRIIKVGVPDTVTNTKGTRSVLASPFVSTKSLKDGLCLSCSIQAEFRSWTYSYQLQAIQHQCNLTNLQHRWRTCV